VQLEISETANSAVKTDPTSTASFLKKVEPVNVIYPVFKFIQLPRFPVLYLNVEVLISNFPSS
jgi:hypothetical protein